MDNTIATSVRITVFEFSTPKEVISPLEHTQFIHKPLLQSARHRADLTVLRMVVIRNSIWEASRTDSHHSRLLQSGCRDELFRKCPEVFVTYYFGNNTPDQIDNAGSPRMAPTWMISTKEQFFPWLSRHLMKAVKLAWHVHRVTSPVFAVPADLEAFDMLLLYVDACAAKDGCKSCNASSMRFLCRIDRWRRASFT